MTTQDLSTVVAGDLAALIPSFERSLRAGNKSAKTVGIYGDAARRLARFSRRWARLPTRPGSPASTSSCS